MKERSRRSRKRSASDVFVDFTQSTGFDSRLWRYDIAGSIAHAHTLARAGVLDGDDLRSISTGLKAIAKDLSSGALTLDPALEDIHMNVEQALTDRVGDAGAKLHTARSRNDQVALDVRLFVREKLHDVLAEAGLLQKALLDRAKESEKVALPGFTHLQHAQPVLLSHHMLAHFWRIQRDVDRLADCYARTNLSPLGSGALAGTSYAIDRNLAASMLGMSGVSPNSLDAVSDRDFVAESVFALSLLMIHLSSMCEELVTWSSAEFGFVKLPKDMSSGSSMMPQKRNPDLPELVRGKSGRTVGDLVAILTLLKSLPLAYNRDLQEDKESLFDAFDAAEDSLRALTHFLAAVQFDEVRMRKAAEAGLMTATDLADFLAKSGVPFRKAHGLVRGIAERSGGDMRLFHSLAAKELKNTLGGEGGARLASLTIEGAIEARDSEGGTSTNAVKKQMQLARKAVSDNQRSLASMNRQIGAVDQLLK